MRAKGEGPIPSRIMLVGEAPGENEERAGLPFAGASGQELNRMLHEAGIMRSECYTTNVCKVRPPDNQIGAFIALKKKDRSPLHVLMRDRYVLPPIVEGYKELLAEIEMVQPNIIVAFGNLAMWALTGHWGITKWRGSLLLFNSDYSNIMRQIVPKVIPTIHPASILREWSQRAIVLNDLRRVKKHMTSRVYDNKPTWNFFVRPTITQVMGELNGLISDCDHCEEIWIDFDIETRDGHIDCIGLSWSRTEGICIPLMGRGKPEGYWSLDEEALIVYHLYKLLTHPKVKIRWQNGLYDAQYVYRHWHFIPRGAQDTMISQHSVFAALPKSLAFIASMYADWYVYWKDEGKIASDAPEEQRWAYNITDCVYTRETGEVLKQIIEAMGLQQVEATQQELFYPVLKAMLKGVRIRKDVKNQMAMDIQEELSHRQAFLYNVLGHEINPSSPKQMQALFYDDLKQPVIYKRSVVGGYTKMSPTCDDEALNKMQRRSRSSSPSATPSLTFAPCTSSTTTS